MLLDVLKDIVLSFWVAIGFALLFEAPKKAVLIAGLLGAFGHVIRYVLIVEDAGLFTATLVGSLFIGVCAIYFAHKIHTPPVVFTIPACITMIPGLYAYRTMLGCIKIYEAGSQTSNSELLQETVYYFILTSSLLFCLIVGICVTTLVFRKRSVKKIRRIQDLGLNIE